MKKTLIFILVLFGCSVFTKAQTIYFVAPNGNDDNNGSIESPFLTIKKAQHKARNVKGDALIYLRQGEYQLKEPLVFTSKDGNEHKSLFLQSYPDENPIISGGVRITPIWKSHQGKILKSEIKLDFPMDMLIVDGTIRHMARFPNYNPAALRFKGTSADATSVERIKRWKNPIGGYLHAMHASDWGDFHYKITGKDKEGKLQLEGGWQNNRQSGLHPDNRMVENIFEELDAPGEWFYDSSESVLYYYPLPDEDVHKVKFEVPHLKHLLEIRGTEQDVVKNITIKGIEFTQTVRTFMEQYEPLLRSDWTVYRGGAVLLEGTQNCNIQNCYLHNLGGNALFFSNFNKNSSISGSHFTRIGASAICFVGNPDAVRSPSFEYSQFVPFNQLDRIPGPKSNDYPANCLAHDNLIHTIGLFEKQITGIEISMSKAITVSHNSIYDTPRAGINISEGTWGGHIIEYNDVFETVKETGDHGSFNSWGRDRFWNPNRSVMDSIVAHEPSLILADASTTVVIRNNRFRCDRGWDIDLDDGSSNFHIYNNLCLNGGLKLREGFYRVVENNIIINNTFHPHVWFKNSGDVFARNLVMTAYQPIGISFWGAQVDNNIFTDSISYKAVRENGTDKHSIVYDAKFQDPEKGDYRINRYSDEIFQLGFQNFNMDEFGVVSPYLKSIAATPKMPIPMTIKKNTGTNIREWQGWLIKNLETSGERSATGMDSERGVYVVSCIAFDSPLRDFLQANDVILELGEKPTDKVDDLFEVIKNMEWSKNQKMIIFRNQKQHIIQLPANTVR